MTWWQQPFFQVALPIIITFAIATWYQNSRVTDLRDMLGKRIDDLKDSIYQRLDAIEKRLDAIEKRFSSIEDLLRNQDRRITTLEERTSPIRR